MGPLDMSIVNATLPVMARDFRAEVLVIEWVVLAYLLTLSSLLLVGGWLGDRFGHRRLYVAGFALFTLSSWLCAQAGQVGMLIAARVLQGVGGAMMIAIGPAILIRAFPPTQRGQALGFQASIVYIGLAVGPGLGGIIATHLGWRWVFFLNLPIGVLAIAAALVVLAPDGRGLERGFDVAGAAGFVLALFSGVLAITEGAASGWQHPLVPIATLCALLIGTGFIVWEARVPSPFLELGLFRNRLFSAATISAVCNYMSSSTVAFLTPFFLIRGNHLAPDRAGALLMGMPLVMALTAPMSGWVSDRIGSRLPTVAGMSTMAAGMWLLGGLGRAPSGRQVVLCLAVIGLGVGLFTSPNNSAIMGSVPRDRQGLASGLVATARTLGNVLGVTCAAALFGAGIQRLLPQVGQDAIAVVQAYGHALRIMAGVAMTGAVASLVRGPRDGVSRC